MNATEINKKRGLLEILIHDAILDSMQWITSQCNGSPQEPDYIATLSTRFPKNLFHILSTCFPKRVFSVTGVYCHQKPIVRIDPKKNPELGDLLLVYIDRDKNNNILMNSLLLQAKVSDVLEKRVSKKEQHQLELYRQWPPFTYQNRADYLNGQERNIVPKTINDGAQYLMIDDNPFTNGMWGVSSFFPMGCAIPDNILRVDKALSEELIDFLNLSPGVQLILTIEELKTIGLK